MILWDIKSYILQAHYFFKKWNSTKVLLILLEIEFNLCRNYIHNLP